MALKILAMGCMLGAGWLTYNQGSLHQLLKAYVLGWAKFLGWSACIIVFVTFFVMAYSVEFILSVSLVCLLAAILTSALAAIVVEQIWVSDVMKKVFWVCLVCFEGGLALSLYLP